MASLPPQECCTQRVIHEGTAKGSLIDIDGTKAYVSGDKSAGKVILFITDIYGAEFINAQLLADTFAQQGYFVVVPDLFNGDAVDRPGVDLKEWLSRHGVAETQPNVDKSLAWIKHEVQPKFLGTVGYCFGAKYVIRMLGDPASGVDAGATAHPSFVTIDEVTAIKKPLLICGAEEDSRFTPELRAQTEEKLKEIKAKYFVTLFSGVAHGFAVRGDVSDPWIKVAKEKAFSDMVWWFSLFQS